MNDYDVKGIERYSKKIKKEMKRESRIYEERRLTFAKPDAKNTFDISVLNESPGYTEPEEAADTDETESIIIDSVVDCRALIVVEHPLNDEYFETKGIDNNTGRRVHIIICTKEINANEPAGSSKTRHNTVRPVELDKSTDIPAIIYLPGEIYKPSPGEWLKQNVFTGRLFASCFMLILFLLPLFIFYVTGNVCYIISDEEKDTETRRIIWTTVNSPREIAETITALNDADRVDVENFGTTKLLSIIRSFPVYITADGETVTVNVLDTSVEELIEREGIEYSRSDLVSLDMDHMLSEGDELVIRRVKYKFRESAPEPIPYGQVRKYSPVMSREREDVLSEGIDGTISRVYLECYIDGVLESSELYGETVIIEPVDEYILCGDPDVPASTVDKNKYTEIEIEDGKPIEYTEVITDAVCTAYSFGTNAFGASGMRLIQGFVATDPEKIPYGTLMYIASDRFTYGWAIAADCGEAMMAGYVDIDCYFDTYDESVMFGKKLMDVYIIGQLTQAQLEEYMANGMFYNRIPRTLEEVEQP